MSDSTPILSLPLIQPAQAQKHVTHNEAIRLLDLLVQLVVSGHAAMDPPAAPEEGERHIVAPGGRSAWAGQDGRIAVFEGGMWTFVAPLAGWTAQLGGDGPVLTFDGTVWRRADEGDQRFGGLGIGTDADAVNRLAVASDATLLTHRGAGHRVTVNKAAAPDTASLLFQTGYSGRAELGLAGNDDLSVKVSGDGGVWREALRIDRTTGQLRGEAVQTGALDGRAGRLMTVGAFGIGAASPLIANASIPDGSIAPGRYGYATAEGSRGGPAGVTTGHLIHMRRSAEGEAQILIAEATGAAYTRARAGADWLPWRRMDPERGSNTNGEYVRFADGTQICTRLAAVTTTGTAFEHIVNLAMPAAFVGPTPAVTMALQPVGVGSIQTFSAVTAICRAGLAGTLGAWQIRSSDTAHLMNGTLIALTAIGRWV